MNERIYPTSVVVGGGETDTNEVTRACLHIWMQKSGVSEELLFKHYIKETAEPLTHEICLDIPVLRSTVQVERK